jgi:hypothetical protein
MGNRRHHAAHDGSASIPVTDLESVPDQIIALAFAFDALCSMATRRFLSGSKDATVQSHVSICLLRVERGIRIIEDEAGSLLGSVPRSTRTKTLVSTYVPAGGFAVFLDRRRLPMSWTLS